jgi:cyclic pyranopterin phosphate synthase
MPHEKFSWRPKTEILSYEEINRLTKIFVGFGVETIRLTGGEPLVRPQIEKLVSSLTKISGIKKVSMTTNGLLLENKLKLLKNAGLQGLNISLDTLVPSRFKKITGVDGLSCVQHAIKSARENGFDVKINTVVIKGQNEDELEEFVKLANLEDLTIRFIEFMPLDGSYIWDPSLMVTKQEMIQRINRNIAELQPLNNDPSDPARLYSIKGCKGTIGFIPSISEPFCSTCNRVRLTSDGKFLTCLFEKSTYDIKTMLRTGKSDKEIEGYLLECYIKKPEGVVSLIRHRQLFPGFNQMNTIGG